MYKKPCKVVFIVASLNRLLFCRSRSRRRRRCLSSLLRSLLNRGVKGSRHNLSPFAYTASCNEGQNKMEQKTPILPNQGWSHAKGKNSPFSHLWFWGGGGGGQGLPIILSKIVGLNCQTDKNTIPIYRLFEVARKTKSFVQELCSYFPKR